MSDYKPIPKHVLDEGEYFIETQCFFRRLKAVDLAKTILYSAANVRGVFVCNREEFKQCCAALEVGGAKPIIDKVSETPMSR
jgi:hypothetical protein